MTQEKKVVYLDKGVEYYPEDDSILLLRCPKCGRENYALAAYSGICCWCGFNGRTLLNQESNEV